MFTSRWVWPARFPICPILGSWGSKVHNNGRFPALDADEPLCKFNASSSAEKSVTVQRKTYKQTVSDISAPCLSAYMWITRYCSSTCNVWRCVLRHLLKVYCTVWWWSNVENWSAIAKLNFRWASADIQLAEASTHRSATTHVGNVFVHAWKNRLSAAASAMGKWRRENPVLCGVALHWGKPAMAYVCSEWQYCIQSQDRYRLVATHDHDLWPFYPQNGFSGTMVEHFYVK